MSYDVEVRSDDMYSKGVSRDRLVDLLSALGARRSASGNFMRYEDPTKGQVIEIDLGNEGSGEGDFVTFVGLGVPYAYLSATGTKALDLAYAIAQALEWRVYDPQAGQYLSESERQSGIEAQTVALRAFHSIEASSSKSGFLTRVLSRFIRQTKFMIVVACLTFGAIAVYAIWNGSETRPRDPRAFIGRVVAAASTVILLRPLVLELLESGRVKRGNGNERG